MANQQSRINQLIFGDAGATAQFGEIGSESAGAAVTTKDLNVIQALTQYLNGLYAITNNGGEPPRIQDFNSLFLLITTQLRYIFQVGIPEWVATAQYFANVSIVQVAGVLYQATTGTEGTPNVNHNPVGDSTNWQVIFTTKNDGNLGASPAPKGTPYSTSCAYPGPTTLLTLPSSNTTYMITSRIDSANAANALWGIIRVSSDGSASIITQANQGGHTYSLSGLSVKLNNGAGSTQTFKTTIVPITF